MGKRRVEKFGRFGFARAKTIGGKRFAEYLSASTKGVAESDKKTLERRGYVVRIHQRKRTARRYPDNRKIKVREYVTWFRPKKGW